MNLPLHVALAAAALTWGVILSAGHAFAAPDEEARMIAPTSAAERSLMKAQAERARVDARSTAHANAVQARFDQLCAFKPVMTDAEIYGCKQAFRL